MEHPPLLSEPVAAVAAVAAPPHQQQQQQHLESWPASLASTRPAPGGKRLPAVNIQPSNKKRRKQSRPIRIPSPSISTTTTETTTTTSCTPLDTITPLEESTQVEEEEAEEGEITPSSAFLTPHHHLLQQHHHQQQQQQQLDAQMHPSSPNHVNSGAAYPDTLANMQSLLPTILSFPSHFLLPMLPSSGLAPSPVSSSSAAVQQGSSGGVPPRIFNLEAYCELCMKEFCNKYFLKTHKANRHGIYVQSGDTPPSSTTPLPPVLVVPTAAAAATVAGTTIEPTPLSVPTNVPSSPAKSVSDPKFNCDMCPKKFNNEISVKRHKVKVHGEAGGDKLSEESSRHEEEIIRDTSTPFDQQDSRGESTTPILPSRSEDDEVLPPATSPLSPGRLRRLGVINADAFCELCKKEYCNKYFLKTHKLKRHGIIVRDSTDEILSASKTPEKQTSGGKLRSWEPSIQTSPLNLTLHEQVGHIPSGPEFGLLISHAEEGEEEEEEDEEEGAHEQRVYKTEPVSPRAEDTPVAADLSEDLQKLQTMLLQLNALNDTTITEVEHEGVSVSENGVPSEAGISPRDSPPPPPVPPPTADLLESCSSQGPPPTTGPTEEPTEQEDSASLGSAGVSTSCYCDICNKELCNKYFKKVHMQKMHGIEIKDNALSGGVPCDICHKQLCSKYFVRVHKQNTHGIVDLSSGGGGGGGSGPPPSSSSPLGTPPAVLQPLPAVTSTDAALKPTEVADLSHRYYTHFNVVCPLCSRRFRSAKWLKAHLVNDHPDTGIDLVRELEPKLITTTTTTKNNSKCEEIEKSPLPATSQNLACETRSVSSSAAVLSGLLQRCGSERTGGNYHCSYCSFSTPVLSLLFVHERSHTGLPAGMPTAFSCHVCFKSFSHAELLQRHVRTHQLAGLASSAEEDTAITESNPSRAPQPTGQQGAAAGRYRCAQCLQRFRTRDLWSAHMQNHRSSEELSSSTSSQPSGPPFICPLCPFSSDVLTVFKKHLKHDHWSCMDSSGSSSSHSTTAATTLWRNLSRSLQEAVREAQVPATYAVPQTPQPERFIMQPFLLEEPLDMQSELQIAMTKPQPLTTTTTCTSKEKTAAHPATDDGSTGSATARLPADVLANSTAAADGTFVPSLVFLPVREKVSGTMTVSFTLTPA